MRGTFYTPRGSMIPKGAQKVSDKFSDAVAYLYASQNRGRSFGKPAMMVFYGQQSKPVAQFYYLTEVEREAAIKKWFSARQQRAAVMTARAAERTAAVATVKFQIGKSYRTRSACDHDCIYSFEIVSRTAKQLTIREGAEIYKRGIYVYESVEHCKPHGTYSMCAVISADREGV